MRNRDFKINGTAVPAGSYSLWIVARPEGDWSLRIDPHVKVDHWFDPDSSADSFGSPPPEIRITSVGNTLRFEAPGMKGMWDMERRKMAWMLVPMGGGLFTYGAAYEGELVELWKSMGFWEFQRKDGKVTGFEVRTFPDDKLWLTGRREQ